MYNPDTESAEPSPELGLIDEQTKADLAYFDRLLEQFPPTDKSSSSRLTIGPEGYWDATIAITSAKLGVPIGLGVHPDAESANDGVLYGSPQAVSYWLHLAGFEHRSRDGDIAGSESRSALYTLLSNPVHGEVFEHVYAVRNGTPIGGIIERDPMYERVRKDQRATDYEFIDHEGVKRAYAEDPERLLRLYLTRSLPRLKYFRKSIEDEKRMILLAELDTSNTDGLSEGAKKAHAQAAKDEAILKPLRQAHIDHKQVQYDFTMGLLLEGYKPYTLEEVVPLIEGYVLGLLAEHAELSPTDLQVEIPDMQARIRKMISDIEASDQRDQMRDKAAEN